MNSYSASRTSTCTMCTVNSGSAARSSKCIANPGYYDLSCRWLEGRQAFAQAVWRGSCVGMVASRRQTGGWQAGKQAGWHVWGSNQREGGQDTGKGTGRVKLGEGQRAVWQFRSVGSGWSRQIDRLLANKPEKSNPLCKKSNKSQSIRYQIKGITKIVKFTLRNWDFPQVLIIIILKKLSNSIESDKRWQLLTNTGVLKNGKK